jgi:hypothetical protein
VSVAGKAQAILRNYPDLVPMVFGEAVRWPDETKRNWMQLFGVRPPVPPNWIVGVVFPKEVDEALGNLFEDSAF